MTQVGTITVGAKLANGTQQAFKAIADGMRTMAKSMSALAGDTKKLGNSAQSKAFGSMAKELTNMSTAAGEMAKSWGEVIEKGEKATKTNQEYAKSSEQVTQELQEEAKAHGDAAQKMTRHQEAAEELRIKYGQLLIGTSKQSDRARELLASLNNTSTSIRLVKVEAAKLNTEFWESAKVQTTFSKTLNETEKDFRKLLTSTDKYGREARELRNNFKQLGGDAAEYKKRLKEIAATQTGSAAAFEKSWKAADGLRRQYDLLATSSGKFGADAKLIIQSLRNMDITAEQARNELFKLNKEFKATEAGRIATERAKRTFQELRVEFKNLLKAQSAYGAGARKLVSHYKNEKITVDQLKKALRDLNKNQKEYIKNQTKMAAAAAKSRQAASKLSLTYSKLIAGSTKYAATGQRIITMLRNQEISASRAAIALEKLNRRALASSTPLADAYARLGRSFKTYMSYVAASSTIFAFIGAARSATKTVIEYDQALKDLQAITRATDQEVEQMGVRIKQVASDTKFSAIEVAEGMKLLGQSGLSASETIETIGAVSDLATGTLTDMATTVDLVTTAMRVFGIEAHDTSRIADVFANAVNRSKLTIDKIRTAMNYIGPVAKAAGASLEETASAMMVLANQGIRASTIGTGLRQVFRRLVDPAKGMKTAMQRANVTIDDFNVKALSLATVVGNLNKVIHSTGDATQAAFEMFGQRGATAALALISGGTKQLLEMMEIVQRTGAAAEMAAIQMEGLGVSFKNLQDKVKNLYIAMGENGLHGALRAFVDTARVLVDFMTGVMSNSIVQLVTQFVLMTTTVYALGRAFKWLIVTVLGKNFFAPLTAGAKAFSVSAGTATVATRVLTGAVTTLKVALSTFWPVALITGALWFISWLTNASERSKKYRDELITTRNEQESNITILKNAIALLESESVVLEDKQKLLAKLGELYPELTTEMETNRDEIENVIPLLEKELKLRQQLKDEAVRAEATDRGRELSKDLERLKKVEALLGDEDIVGKRRAKLEKEFVELRQKTRKEVADLARLLDTELGDILSGRVLEGVGFEMVGATEEAVKRVAAIIQKNHDDLLKQAEEYAEKHGVTMAEAQAAMAGLLSVEDIEQDYKEDLALLEKNLELKKAAIRRYVSNNVDAQAEGERKIQALEIQAAADKIKLADETALKLHKKGGYEEEAALLIKRQQMEEAHYKKLGTYLDKHTDDIVKANQQLADKERTHNQKIEAHRLKTEQLDGNRDQARIDRKEAIAGKVEDIERDLAQKITDINTKLKDKLKDLSDKRVEIEKQARADILGIEQSFEEKLLKLSQRGMSDKEKELSNESFAREQFSDAQAALSAAIRGGDVAGVDAAAELFEKAGDYFGDLADTSKARSGIMSVRDALISARKEQEKLEKAKNSKEVSDAQAKAQQDKDKAKREAADQLTDFTQAQDKKLAKALDTIKQQEAAEDARWQKELANYDAAIAKIEEKKQAALQAQQEINAYMDQSEYGKSVDAAGKDIKFGESGAGGVQPVDEKKTEEAIKRSAKKALGSQEVTQEFGNALDMSEVKIATAASIAEGVAEGMAVASSQDMVNGMPLDQFFEMGKEQGEAMGEEMGKSAAAKTDDVFKTWMIDKNPDGIPIGVTIDRLGPNKIQPMIESIQEELDKQPGEPSLDFSTAERAIKAWLTTAQRNYQLTIPVSIRQAQSEGGPVYHMNSGGRLPGQSSPHDSLTVKARPGEWFIKNESVSQWARDVGNWFMPGVNRPNSTAGKILQGMLARGAAATSQPEVPNMGSLTIRMGDRQAEVMGTPVNLKTFANMMQDVEAYSS